MFVHCKGSQTGHYKEMQTFWNNKEKNTTETKETEIIIKALQKEFRVRANIVINIHKVKPQIELSRRRISK